MFLTVVAGTFCTLPGRRERALKPCHDRSFECDVSKHIQSAAQSAQAVAEGRICIGRLMCFPPRPLPLFSCDNSLTAGKMGHGRGREKVESGFCLSKKRTDKPNSLISAATQWWHGDGGAQTLAVQK